ncbi:protein kinase [Kitasatospora sp. NPDC059577]|uniref:serine/threonine-protein kinase n=1 Tax=Kitasatospora sp. NPDC059577 TaxID=3346873 RepID=UPI00367F00B8
MEPLHDTDPEAVGPYRLFARLGEGGMGEVYLARSAGGRTVAVKVVRSELARDTVFRSRFRREVAAARAVDAVHTAPVVDADPDGPAPWLATAYVPGPPLSRTVHEHGPLPEPSARALGARLAEALEAIHGAGLVHRDLKPSNVLLTADGPRVIDFGIARALDDDDLTRTGGLIGSPGFMSPEQAGGLPTGAPGDVFSLASVLVFAVTGHGPFESAAGVAAQVYKVVHEEPDLADVPPALREVVEQCLRKDPARRPLPADLRALLSVGAADGEWLPAPVAAGLARHAATVMNLEAPLRVGGGPSEAPTIARNRTRVDVTDPSDPSVRPVAPVPQEGAGSRPGVLSRRRLLLSGGALAVTAAAGAATWALTRPDSPRGGTGAPPEPVWTVATEGTDAGPRPGLVVDDLVLLHADTLLAVDAATGEGRWENRGAGNTSYLVGGSDLYELSGTLRRLALADGSASDAAADLMGAGRGVAFESLLAATDRRLYLKVSVAPVDGEGATVVGILCTDRDLSGREWFQEDPDSSDLDSPGAVGGGVLLHLDNGNDVVARRADGSGGRMWRAGTGSSTPRPVRCDDRRAYCAVDGTGLQAVGLGDGRQVWRLDPRAGRIGDFAVADGSLYLSLGARSFSAVDAETGKVRWTCPLPGDPSVSQPPVRAGGTVFVPGEVPREPHAVPCVHALDAATGRLRWTFTDPAYQPGGEALGCRLSTDGKLVFAWIRDTVSALPVG